MADKIRALIVGGEKKTLEPVRHELEQHLNYKHVIATESQFRGDISRYQVVIIVGNWMGNQVLSVLASEARKFKIPWVKLPSARQIISGLSEHEQFKHLFPANGNGAPAKEESKVEAPEETTTGLAPKELWKIYGQKTVDIIKESLSPGECDTEDRLFPAIADLVGIPVSDFKVIVPELLIRGVLDEPKKGHWRRVDPDKPDSMIEKRSASPDPSEHGRRKHGSFLANLMRGLPPGPYASTYAIGEEFRKYKEFKKFDGEVPSHSYARLVAQKAQRLGYVETVGDKVYIKHDPSIKLTLLQVKEDAPKKEQQVVAEEAAPKEQTSSTPRYAPIGDLFGKTESAPKKPKDLLGHIGRPDILPGTVKRLKMLIPPKHWDECATKSIDVRAKAANLTERPPKVDFTEDEWDTLAWETLRKLTLGVVAPVMKEVYEDEKILCFDCGEPFIFTKSWQEDLFARFGDDFVKPKRCARCKREKNYDSQDKIESRYDR